MCPVCTVTVVAGLWLSRTLGIDDVITSLWIGGFILSFSFITINWLEKSKWQEKIYGAVCKFKCGMTEFQALKFWVIFLMYSLVIIPLFFSHTIGIKGNTLWGIDKILLGIIIGSIVFLVGVWSDKEVRKARDGKQLFIYQKVAFPVAALIAASLGFYFAL